MRTEATDPVGDVRPPSAGVAERPRIGFGGGRIEPGRVDGALLTGGAPGRGRPDMVLKCRKGAAMLVMEVYLELHTTRGKQTERQGKMGWKLGPPAVAVALHELPNRRIWFRASERPTANNPALKATF